MICEEGWCSMWRYSFLLLFMLAAMLPADDYIMFPHLLHVEDMGLACDECHGTVADATDLTVRLLPEKDSCLECHDGDFATDECDACHADMDEPLPFYDSQPLHFVDFSHQYHLTAGRGCEACHPGVAEDDGSALPRIWNESNCQACHSSSRPASHTTEWSWLHGIELTHANQASCNTCHEQATCDACHLVQEVEPKVHPAGFILQHGFAARAGNEDCSTCHSLINDCRSCHRANQVMPMDHNLPDWVSLDGGLHDDAAMDEADICATCHQPASDPGCARCH